MLIIGCDYHPSVQQIAWVDRENGECGERRLLHSDGEAEGFYRELKQRGVSVRVGIEATGHARWFEGLLAELGFELWTGDAAAIRAKRVRKQKTDRQDAQHLLQLLGEDRFPRVWVPSPENRDLRQLLWHRHRLVQMRTRINNQLQAIAMNEGVRRKKGLWTKLRKDTAGGVFVSSVGHPAPARPLGIAGPAEPEHRETKCGDRARSRATAGSAKADDPSGHRPDHGAGLCVGHRASGSISLWQADRQLPRACAQRRFQRRSSTARTPQQARECNAAFLAGGGGGSCLAFRSGLATAVRALDYATQPVHRKSGNGPQTGSSLVLDVTSRMGLPAGGQFRPHAG